MLNSQKINFWFAIIIAFGFFIYLIGGILLPFVVGILVAYFLDPIADKLEKHGFSRTGAAIVILATFFTTMVMLSVIIIPLLAEQLFALANKIPLYADLINSKIEPKILGLLGHFDEEIGERFKAAFVDISGYLFNVMGGILANIWQSGVAILNLISLVLISPVVAFYILRDWDKITAKIDNLIPRAQLKNIRQLLAEIDESIAGFIRGQATVVMLLGIFYATALAIIGLDAALVIGLGSGLLTILPYVGILFGMLVGILVAFFQFGDAVSILLVASIFILGQFLEGTFITPKLVGEKVGLHPVWIIFGMLSGGALFGFVGIIIAIPVTAVIGVLLRFATSEYLQSNAYGTPKKVSTQKRKKKKITKK